MATVRIRGRRGDRSLAAEWRQETGEATGDEELLELANFYVAEGEVVGLPGLEEGPATLEAMTPPAIAAATLAAALDVVDSLELPPRDELADDAPPGAVLAELVE
jgi:hypothetical protein